MNYFKLLLAVFFFLSFAIHADAQGKGNGKGNGKGHGKKEHVKKEKTNGPPAWAPAHGYRKRHIFFPEHNVYYDSQKQVYIAKEEPAKEQPTKEPSKEKQPTAKEIWNITKELPEKLKDIDLKKAKQVELDLDGIDDPQKLFDKHLKEFGFKK